MSMKIADFHTNRTNDYS